MEGVRVVAHDSVGQVVGGLNRRIRSEGIETLEAYVILEGTRMETEKGWTSVEIESYL